MKPAPFKYYDPETTAEAVALLRQYGDDVKIMAGGQSLGPILNMRLAVPTVIIDINRIAALAYVEQADHIVKLGAMTRQSFLEDSATFQQQQPLIAATIPYIGHRAIRNRGTVGGSLVHADPAAEWPMLAVMLSAEIGMQGGSAGSRTVAAEEFFVDFLMTAVAEDELVTEIILPTWPTRAGWSFIEFSRRHGDFAIAGVGVLLQLDENDRCQDVRIGLLGVHPTPCRARRSEAVLRGRHVSEASLREAAQHAVVEIEPGEDIHASAAYRRHLTIILVERALKQAYHDCLGKRAHV